VARSTYVLVCCRDIWPTQEEIAETIKTSVLSEMFKEVYGAVTRGTPQWNSLKAPTDKLYPWDESSTYIHNPPFFSSMELHPSPQNKIEDAHVLLLAGDFITTDHISPAGNISVRSPAARYLMERGVDRKDFNSYGARRGNDQVMARGTFANIRLTNKLLGGKVGPQTIHHPTGEVLDIWDAAERYINAGTPLTVLAGEQYGSGTHTRPFPPLPSFSVCAAGQDDHYVWTSDPKKHEVTKHEISEPLFRSLLSFLLVPLLLQHSCAHGSLLRSCVMQAARAIGPPRACGCRTSSS
jgi:hypothetical protein